MVTFLWEMVKGLSFWIWPLGSFEIEKKKIVGVKGSRNRE